MASLLDSLSAWRFEIYRDALLQNNNLSKIKWTGEIFFEVGGYFDQRIMQYHT